eukprot:jgi/Botrbrau1/3610/Bobra.0204s0007.2
MDAITKVNTYFPSTTWTSFTVLANLVIENAQTCTQAQFVILWVLIGLFCAANYFLCFTDSVSTSAGKHTVLLFPGWLIPDRLLRAVWPTRFPIKRTASVAKALEDGLLDSVQAEIYEKLGLSLSTKAVFLPDIPVDDPNRDKIYYDFEDGARALSAGDFIQAWLTTGTFFTLAVLNTAYVYCTFPNYNPRNVQNQVPVLSTLGRKLLAGESGYVPGTRIDPTVIRTVPTIIAFFVGGILSFIKAPRQMVGYTQPTSEPKADAKPGPDVGPTYPPNPKTDPSPDTGNVLPPRIPSAKVTGEPGGPSGSGAWSQPLSTPGRPPSGTAGRGEPDASTSGGGTTSPGEIDSAKLPVMGQSSGKDSPLVTVALNTSAAPNPAPPSTASLSRGLGSKGTY